MANKEIKKEETVAEYMEREISPEYLKALKVSAETKLEIIRIGCSFKVEEILDKAYEEARNSCEGYDMAKLPALISSLEQILNIYNEAVNNLEWYTAKISTEAEQ